MLKLSHLTIVRENTPIIKDFSLTIEPGTIHALMGPNGSGKSTLALTIMGHPNYEIVQGSLSFYEENLLAMPAEKRARLGLFLACQYPPALPGVSVLTFLKESHRMLTGQDLSMASFKELVAQTFHEVKLEEHFMHRSVNEGFSGGEKKRFEMAQLMLFKPKLALLDEIDSGLDVDTLLIVGTLLNQLKAADPAFSLLIITHYNRLLDCIRPDQVHILSKGKLWLSGTTDILKDIEERGYDGLLL